MRRLGDHIQQEVGKLRVAIEKLQRDVDNCKPEDKQQRERLIAKATEVGDGFMRLEKCAAGGVLFPRCVCVHAHLAAPCGAHLRAHTRPVAGRVGGKCSAGRRC